MPWRGALIIPVATALAACTSVPPSAPVGISPSAMAASTPTPSAAVANRPPARFGGAIAYDAANHTVVLFGGHGLSGYLNDTWTWDGARWTEQHPRLSPTARYGARMAYDATNKVVVLLGGIGNLSSSQIGDLDDTWTWNGMTWTEQHPAATPPPRHGSSLAYDGTLRQILLFGGDSGARVPVFMNDTWVWNGTRWAQLNPASSPPPRADASMAYDEVASQLVLFGGAGAIAVGDTWIWDGRSWTQQAPSLSPSARYAASAGYSASDRTLVLFGGYSGFSGARLNETWAWNGTTWNQLHPSNQPRARVDASLSAAPIGGLLLFGGSGDALKGEHSELNDTWSWHDAAWTPAPG
jgi:hypothetical protein